MIRFRVGTEREIQYNMCSVRTCIDISKKVLDDINDMYNQHQAMNEGKEVIILQDTFSHSEQSIDSCRDVYFKGKRIGYQG